MKVFCKRSEWCGVQIIGLHRSELFVDTTKQRIRVNKRRIKQLAKHFNTEIGNFLIVWLDPSDGRYHIVDGQHRFYASPSDKFVCLLLEGTNPIEAFDLLNKTTRVKDDEKFWLYFGDNSPKHIDIVEICHDAGINLCRTTPGQAPHQLVPLYNYLGRDQFIELIEELVANWQHPKKEGVAPEVLQSRFLRGVQEYLMRFGGSVGGFRRNSRKLARMGYDSASDAINLAIEYRKANSNSGSDGTLYVWIGRVFRRPDDPESVEP